MIVIHKAGHTLLDFGSIHVGLAESQAVYDPAGTATFNKSIVKSTFVKGARQKKLSAEQHLYPFRCRHCWVL